MRIPFGRTAKEEDGDRPADAFADYCRDELERRRDSGSGLDEKRFEAAVALVVSRLRAMEAGEGDL